MGIQLSIQLSLRNTEKNKQLVVPRRDRLVLSYIVRCKLWAFSCFFRNKEKNRQLIAPRRGRLCALLWSTKRLHCFQREASYYTNVSVYKYMNRHRARIIAIGYCVLLLGRLLCISLLIIAFKNFLFHILVDCLLLGWYVVHSIKTSA